MSTPKRNENIFRNVCCAENMWTKKKVQTHNIWYNMTQTVI